MRKTRDNPELIARTCEEILISLGRSVEAYERDAITANRGTSYAAEYRAIAGKHPDLAVGERTRISGTQALYI
jgi:hypothetical protein